jgi:hypothetical protein
VSARELLPLVFACAGLLLVRPAHAQVSVETQIAARKVEVGTGVQFQITALSEDDEAPANPRLPEVPGLSIQGPNLGSRTQVSINNGRMVRQSGISATWTVRPLKVGTFRIGPASVEWGGKRFQGQVATLEVVPQGSLPAAPTQRGPQPFDPFRFFDPFGGGSPFPPGLFDQDTEPEAEQMPPVPEELRVERAPDPIAFLRAVVTPKHPVVGEQVTVRFYAYGSRGGFRLINPVFSTHPDFLDYSNSTDPLTDEASRVPIGDAVFVAKKVSELCLIPLRAGKLGIGPLSLTFDGPRYRANPALVRSSLPLVVDVSEPPVDGRPAGYRIGDVGTLELTAAVDPKRLVAGDALSVVAKLEGTGSIPTVLRVPEQRGVEWAEPTRVDEVGAERGVVRGFRAFNYLVRLTEPGSVDLGELTLPYWDPRKREYRTVRAKLGTVEVTPNPKAAPIASAGSAGASHKPGDPLAFKPRRTLGDSAPARTPFTDGARFWYLLFGAPLAVALTGIGLDVGGRLRRRRASKLTSPARLAQEALKAAEAAARSSEIAKTAAAIERALFLAIEAGTGLRARALLKPDLQAALAEAHVDAAAVTRALELLDACESARFTGKVGELSPKELCSRARGVVAELSRKRRSPKT